MCVKKLLCGFLYGWDPYIPLEPGTHFLVEINNHLPGVFWNVLPFKLVLPVCVQLSESEDRVAKHWILMGDGGLLSSRTQ